MNIDGFVVDLTLILVVTGIVTIIFKKLKQPLVLGYIVAGFLFKGLDIFGGRIDCFEGVAHRAEKKGVSGLAEYRQTASEVPMEQGNDSKGLAIDEREFGSVVIVVYISLGQVFGRRPRIQKSLQAAVHSRKIPFHLKKETGAF